jgi:hypothetical protein
MCVLSQKETVIADVFSLPKYSLLKRMYLRSRKQLRNISWPFPSKLL